MFACILHKYPLQTNTESLILEHCGEGVESSILISQKHDTNHPMLKAKLATCWGHTYCYVLTRDGKVMTVLSTLMHIDSHSHLLPFLA